MYHHNNKSANTNDACKLKKVFKKVHSIPLLKHCCKGAGSPSLPFVWEIQVISVERFHDRNSYMHVMT